MLNSAEEAINNVTTRVNLAGNLLIHLDEKCEALTDEVKGMKRNKTKPNLIIRGVVETKDESKEQLGQSVKDFFKDQMSIEDEIGIKKMHRLGHPGNQDRPIMIKLKDADDKAKIYKSVSNLKGKKNVRRWLFQIDNDLDPEQAEKKNYYCDLAKKNAGKDEQDRLQLKFMRGEIMANNEVIKPQLLDPTAAQLLTMTHDKMQEIKAVKVIKSEEFTKKGSDYIAYIQKTKSISEIQKGLYKMRLKYADATHISCAY